MQNRSRARFECSVVSLRADAAMPYMGRHADGGGDFSRAEAATERPLTLDVPKFAAPIGRRRAGG